MSDGLSRAEQELVEVGKRPSIFFGLDGSIETLVREVRRSEADVGSPAQAMVVRVSLTARLIEKVERAQVFLATLSQALAELQDEQVKRL